MRLGEDLEAVADAEDRASCFRELLQWDHDLREAGDGTRAEVVAIGEAAGYDHGVHALEVGVGVPELDCVRAHPLHAVQGVPVAIRAGEDRDTYPQETTSHSYSSIV